MRNQFQRWQKEIGSWEKKTGTGEGTKKLFKKTHLTPEDLSQWDINIYQAEKVRAAWKLYTDQGVFSLKKTPLPPARLTFIAEGAVYVRRNNFIKTLEYLPLRTGTFFLTNKTDRFVLTRWIEGKESNMKDPRQEYQAAVTMAQFHQASQGFHPSVELPRVSRLGLLEKDLAVFTNEIADFFTTASQHPSPGKLENFIIQNNDGFLTKAHEALDLLKNFNYPHFIRRFSHTFALLHQDFAYHNLIRHQGEIYLIDLDYLTWDLRCIDIVKFLRRNLRTFGWKKKTAENILQGYQSITPLEPEEFQLIYILLSFPYKYWQTLHIHFQRPRKHHLKRPLRTLKLLVEQEKDKDNFLKYFAEKYLPAGTP